MEQYEWADKIVSVSPSYWADIPGQFKVFIDRCTPWCNTHEPHAKISSMWGQLYRVSKIQCTGCSSHKSCTYGLVDCNVKKILTSIKKISIL